MMLKKEMAEEIKSPAPSTTMIIDRVRGPRNRVLFSKDTMASIHRGKRVVD
jgi:hypothetical protein